MSEGDEVDRRRHLNGQHPSVCIECPIPAHTAFRCLWLTLTTSHGLGLTIPRAWLVLLATVASAGVLLGASLALSATVAVELLRAR